MNELKKLLDNGWYIQIFRNALKTYTAEAARNPNLYVSNIEDTENFGGEVNKQRYMTDATEPEVALRELVDKVINSRMPPQQFDPPVERENDEFPDN